MEKTCPQCGAPLSVPENKNRMIDEQLVKCEYCGYSYKVDPEFKKVGAAVSLLKRYNDHIHSEENIQYSKKVVKVSLVGFLILGVFMTVLLIIFNILGV